MTADNMASIEDTGFSNYVLRLWDIDGGYFDIPLHTRDEGIAQSILEGVQNTLATWL